jgi:hypothetical protein
MVDNIYTAISEFQANPPALLKDGRGQYGAYLTLGNLLDQVLPALNGLGVTLTQAVTQVDGQPALTTTLTHAASNSEVEGTMLLMSESLTPQKQGGAITYARRYALAAMLGVAPDEDDDAADAQRSAVPARNRATTSTENSSPRQVAQPF